MTTDYRALCAELASYLQGRKDLEYGWPGDDPEQDLLDRARTALAQPEPEGPEPTRRQIMMLADGFAADPGGLVLLVRKALRRWGRPTPQPIPVNERLPGPGDCDAEGRCWAWYCDDPDVEYEGNFWAPLQLSLVTLQNVTHWLPASAIPNPHTTTDTQ